MKIDARKLKEVIPKKARRKFINERFYAVPNATGYSLSDYGRLYYGNKKVKPIFKKGIGLYPVYYKINFDDKEEPEDVRIDKLIAMVFRPNEEIYCLVNPKWGESGKWCVKDLYVIKSKEEMVEYIKSKTEGIEANYSGAKEEHRIVNRNEYTRPIALIIAKTYISMKYRAGRWKNYKDVSVSEKWDTCDPFYLWYLENNYYYPEPLELDKDLMTFGTGKIYSPETCCLLPRRLNIFFSSNYGGIGVNITIRKRRKREQVYRVLGKKIHRNYFDALKHTREERAKQIREIVKEEREKGYMPEYLINKMSKWADLTEIGLIQMWEPEIETLMKRGVI